MSKDKTEETFEFPQGLLERAKKCAEERGFRDLEHFVNKSVRDAVNAEDPLTEEARKELQEVQEAYKRGEGTPLEEVIEQSEVQDLED